MFHFFITITSIGNHGYWDARIKSDFIRCGVVLKKADNLVGMAAMLFERPVPSVFSLENLMRVLVEVGDSNKKNTKISVGD